MPVTDGYEACRLIRNHFSSNIALRNSTPKILAVSGYVDDEIKIKTEECGFENVYEAPLGAPQIM